MSDLIRTEEELRSVCRHVDLANDVLGQKERMAATIRTLWEDGFSMSAELEWYRESFPEGSLPVIEAAKRHADHHNWPNGWDMSCEICTAVSAFAKVENNG